jgi:hypothetical protein
MAPASPALPRYAPLLGPLPGSVRRPGSPVVPGSWRDCDHHDRAALGFVQPTMRSPRCRTIVRVLTRSNHRSSARPAPRPGGSAGQTAGARGDGGAAPGGGDGGDAAPGAGLPLPGLQLPQDLRLTGPGVRGIIIMLIIENPPSSRKEGGRPPARLHIVAPSSRSRRASADQEETRQHHGAMFITLMCDADDPSCVGAIRFPERSTPIGWSTSKPPQTRGG